MNNVLIRIFYKLGNYFNRLYRISALQERHKVRDMNNAKMVSFGKKISEIHHEINNSLTIIKGNMLFLKEFTDNGEIDKEEFKEIIKTSNNICNGISNTIKGLLISIRNDLQDNPRNTNVVKIITDTLNTYKEKITMPINIYDSEVLCREDEISQNLLNLLYNVKDERKNKEKSIIQIKSYVKDSKIYIVVEDSKKGISQRICAKISGNLH